MSTLVTQSQVIMRTYGDKNYIEENNFDDDKPSIFVCLKALKQIIPNKRKKKEEKIKNEKQFIMKLKQICIYIKMIILNM